MTPNVFSLFNSNRYVNYFSFPLDLYNNEIRGLKWWMTNRPKTERLGSKKSGFLTLGMDGLCHQNLYLRLQYIFLWTLCVVGIFTINSRGTFSLFLLNILFLNFCYIDVFIECHLTIIFRPYRMTLTKNIKVFTVLCDLLISLEFV